MAVTWVRVDERSSWDEAVASMPEPHLLQSWSWGEHKRKYEWEPIRLSWIEEGTRTVAVAQVLKRQLRARGLRLKVLYCPRGPIFDWRRAELCHTVLQTLEALAKDEGALFLKIDPEGPEGERPAGSSPDRPPEALSGLLRSRGWEKSGEIQFPNTFVLDLRRTEEEVLAGMKQKTRYNVRLAERRGVRIREGSLEDIPLLYRMYAATSLRDRFVIREEGYYRDAWGAFVTAGLAQPLVAEVGGEPVAALIVYRFADRAWYLYGMSTERHRETMPNHLLQWEAIRWAKRHGCVSYDLWGAPERLEPEDPLWGVYRFKQGFGAEYRKTTGAWDYTTRPLLRWVFVTAMPRILALMRARRRALTRKFIDQVDDLVPVDGPPVGLGD